jgi:hypothetical protein
MSLFNSVFTENVSKRLDALSGAKAKEGMQAIIEGFEQKMKGADLRWLAYMLATAFHETAATMQPVREAYWLSEKWRKKNLSYYPYYGRGYVQLTHKGNYKKAGNDVGENLVKSPDKALEPGLAAHIMFVGMKEGWFRSDDKGQHTLSRYFSQHVDDPVGARKIVNGKETKIVGGKKTTVAAIIARYHDIFITALTEASKLAGTSAQSGSNIAAKTSSSAEATSMPSSRFLPEREALVRLAHSVSLSVPMELMLDLREMKLPSSHPRYWALIDFRLKSDQPRLHVFDIEEDTVSSYLCAHGQGSDPMNSGFARSFSNEDGSGQSSLGVYLCAETYSGIHGYSMRLDGLESTNDHARHRAIVLHPADYVSDSFAAKNNRVGRSLGCPAVDAKYSRSIIDRLKLGSLLTAWTD